MVASSSGQIDPLPCDLRNQRARLVDSPPAIQDGACLNRRNLE